MATARSRFIFEEQRAFEKTSWGGSPAVTQIRFTEMDAGWLGGGTMGYMDET